jgi:hypothetical protein
MPTEWMRRSALGVGVVVLAAGALMLWVLAVIVGPFIADGLVVWGEVIPPRDPRLAHHIAGWRLGLCLAGIVAAAGAYRCYRALRHDLRQTPAA